MNSQVRRTKSKHYPNNIQYQIWIILSQIDFYTKERVFHQKACWAYLGKNHFNNTDHPGPWKLSLGYSPRGKWIMANYPSMLATP